MRIIGIDPGVAITGWAIIEVQNSNYKVIDFGVIETDKIFELPDRLNEIYIDLNKILSKYRPEIAGVEKILFYNNAKTAISVGESRGVVLLALKNHNITIQEPTPLQVKSNITGFGRADKKQVQRNVQKIFNLDEIPTPDDAADALAIAFCTLLLEHGKIGQI